MVFIQNTIYRSKKAYFCDIIKASMLENEEDYFMENRIKRTFFSSFFKGILSINSVNKDMMNSKFVKEFRCKSNNEMMYNDWKIVGKDLEWSLDNYGNRHRGKTY